MLIPMGTVTRLRVRLILLCRLIHFNNTVIEQRFNKTRFFTLLFAPSYQYDSLASLSPSPRVTFTNNRRVDVVCDAIVGDRVARYKL